MIYDFLEHARKTYMTWEISTDTVWVVKMLRIRASNLVGLSGEKKWREKDLGVCRDREKDT